MTQKKGVSSGTNERKIQVFLALCISEGFEKNIYHIWVDEIVAKSRIEAFFWLKRRLILKHPSSVRFIQLSLMSD